MTAVVLILGGYAVVGGLVSFLGWPLDRPRLTDWFDDGVSIQPNSCLLLMLSGAGVLLARLRAWRVVMTLGVLVGIGGLLILLQHIFAVDFGVNHQLLFGREWGRGSTVTPGMAGPPASSSFVAVGVGLVLLARSGLSPDRARLRRVVPVLGTAVCALMVFSLLGYLFGAAQFYSITWLTAIAFPTASMLLATGAALIVLVPERDPMLLLLERSGAGAGAGALARITIPTLVIMIPFVHWLRIEGYERGVYDIGTGRALGALTLMIGAIAVVWIALLALRRHEQAWREEARRKDEFLATLAHELRNPLAPLTNGLALLEVSANDRAATRDARAMMSRQLAHLVRLIDDLLDVSRISRGRIEIRKERVELQSVLSQAIEAIRPVCQAGRQELSVSLPSRPVWIDADPVRLAQIVLNLLSNAARYSGPETEIELQAAVDDRAIVVRVRDRGIGIPRDKLETIFMMFNQIDTSLGRASGGLGIGLYLSRRLAQMQGGTITAHSEGPGTGSEFVLRMQGVCDEPGEPGEPDEAGEPRDADSRAV